MESKEFKKIFNEISKKVDFKKYLQIGARKVKSV